MRFVGARLLVVALALSSCQSYSDRTQAALADFQSGRFDEARAQFADPALTDSKFLAGAEAGTAALAAGQWELAQTHFDEAVAAVAQYEERAIVGVEAAAEELTTLLVNESASTYPGEGYERAQVHAALALTYLARGDLDGVYVETRRANKLLESDEKLYAKQYAAGGFAHFMSAVSYELQRQYDNAYIDYQRMAEKGVGLELAGKALVRIAARLRYDDVLPQLVEAYGAPSEIPADAAQIVVIAGVGLGAFKVEQTVAFPAPGGLVQFSVPVFVPRPQPVSGLALRVDGGAPLATSVIENVSAVAKENLHDRLTWLAARSALRGALKFAATRAGAKMAEEKHGAGAGAAVLIAGALFTAATERADTRCWSTAPDAWHAARMFVAPGRRELALDALGGATLDLGAVQIEPGETVFVIARTLGARVWAHRVGGADIVATTETPAPPSQRPQLETTEAQP